jgi:hypothetical protein
MRVFTKRKIQLLFIIGLLLFSLLGFSQTVTNPSNSYLPNINPPSPEAFAITEYGKNGVTEYTGKLNLSIPIYNYTVGQLSLPINLNYSGAGVKVNDIATWTGINWNLTPSGVISRRVNDFADEGNHSRKYINLDHLLNNASDLCAPYSQEYIDLSNFGDVYDTETDVFNFSFGSYSGSFYLDENYSPVYIENEHEIKIELDGSQATNKEKLRQSKTFIITTPDGVKYYFGGIATEYTRMVSGNIHNTVDANTGFYLFKIEHPINGIINFYYKENVTTKIIDLHTVYSCQAGTSNGTILYTDPYTSLNLRLMVVNPIVLSKITSDHNNIEIDFNTTQYINHNFTSTLDNIEIKNGTTFLKSIDFTYGAKKKESQLQNDFTTASRFFLEKVEINKNLDLIGNKYELYSMEYNHPFDLPERLSTGQDLSGYYNGRDTNETLIASPPNYTVIYNSFLADRYPLFSKASLGALTKITYPTKGFSKFEYESVSAREKKMVTYSNEAGYNGTSHIPTWPGETDAFGNQNVVFPPVFKDQRCVIKMITEQNTGEGGNTATHGLRASLTITDVTPNLPLPLPLPTIITQSFGQVNESEWFHHFDFLKDHSYTFEFKVLGGNPSSQYNDLINARFEFEIHEGYNNVEGLGVRLKRQSDFSQENVSTNVKRYYYQNITLDDTYPTPEILHMPRTSYEWDTNANANSGVGVFPNNYPEGLSPDKSILHSEPANKYFNASNGEFYDVVSISYGGDHFENGGTEKYFTYMGETAAARVPLYNDGCWNAAIASAPDQMDCGVPGFDPLKAIHFVYLNYKTTETTDNSALNGRLIGERNYKKINNQLSKISEKIYEYEINENLQKKVTNFIGKNIFGRILNLSYCGIPVQNTPARQSLVDFYMAYYHINCFNFKLNKVITKEYIDPVPLTVYQPMYESDLGILDPIETDTSTLEAAYKKITNTQNYTYGTLKGLPTAITSSTSENTVENKTINTYINTPANLSLLPAGQAALYTSLLAQNRVESPVQTQQYKNTELLSTQRTLFNNFTINSIIKILPEKIQVSKGDLTINPLEDKAIFYNYDARFNPVVMGYKDGLKTRYMYNNDDMVVAKIENYTGTTTNFPIIKGNIAGETPCDLHQAYPNSFVTVFMYNLETKKLIQTTDFNCRDTFYIYDALHRLQQIKDHDGNVIKEFDNNYRPQ